MKIYLAAAQNSTSMELLMEANAPRWLYSFFYVNEKTPFPEDKDIFLDSGGYSARVQGAEVLVHQYITYAKQHENRVSAVANLDTASLEESQKNLQEMLSKKIDVVPVWHVRWPFSVFQDYCRAFGYVAIGGVVGTRNQQLNADGLTRVMAPAVRFAYAHNTKLHWFGGTHLKVLRRLPFYSTDSSSWLTGGRYGMITLFDQGRMLTFSYRDGNKIIKHVRALQYPLEEIVEKYKVRDMQNVSAYLQMEKWLTELWSRKGVCWDENN